MQEKVHIFHIESILYPIVHIEPKDRLWERERERRERERKREWERERTEERKLKGKYYCLYRETLDYLKESLC